eukprot:TRINITY_DN83522_c0_g1_i1.p1 TRINITY_DN83522_c0_g1~~TRINITY_DN83522_c0_g1_i1.p1  ORF type:complete len:282 (+),score=71.57 TRINITY_DN83522_c0_g1_i1:85-930(+)
MGGSSSAEDKGGDLLLPQQQVVSSGSGRYASSVAASVPGATRVAAQAQHSQTEQVKIGLVWDKHVTVERSPSGKSVWKLSASFKADEPCKLQACFYCRESSSDGTLAWTAADAQAPPSQEAVYAAGSATFGAAIDLQAHPLNVYFKYSRDRPDVIPIVLSLSASGIQSVMHLALQLSGSSLEAKVLKQKAIVRGQEYVLQEIYGLAELSKDSGDNHDEASAGEPCVICLSEPRTTAVLPCSHLCVCATCGGALRVRGDRCPICRQDVRDLRTFTMKSGEEH